MRLDGIRQATHDDYFQSIRGLCIICVVLIHCATGITWKNHTTLNFNYDYWLVLRQFINFPIAIFIFLSAYFINIEQASKKPLLFLSNRLQRLLIPYLIWSIFYFTINAISNGTLPKINDVLLDVLTGRAAGPFYFIIVLVQLTLIAPLIVHNISKKWFNVMCCIITPLYLILIYIFNFKTKQQMPYYETFIFPWFLFYFAGLYIKINNFVINKGLTSYNGIMVPILFLAFSLSASIFEGYALMSLGLSESFAVSQIKISSFLYSLAVINMFFTIRQYSSVPITKSLISIGNISYGIFYLHIFALMLVYKIQAYISFYIPYINLLLPIKQLVQLSLTIILCIFIIEIIRKTLGYKKASYLLGT